jgi:hypothetical protein
MQAPVTVFKIQAVSYFLCQITRCELHIQTAIVHEW